MQKLILLILVGVWAAVLVPPALRSRVQGRPGDSISDFNRRLDILGRTRSARRSAIPRIGARSARPVAPYRTTTPLAARTTTPLVTRSAQPALRVAAPMTAAARRRRDVFVGLLVAVAVTFVAAVWRGGMVWAAHLLVDVALASYVYLLVQMRNAAAQRRLAYPPLRGLAADAHDAEPESRLHLVRAASRGRLSDPTAPASPTAPSSPASAAPASGSAVASASAPAVGTGPSAVDPIRQAGVRAREQLSAKHVAREAGLRESRAAIQAAAASIRAVHREEFAAAAELCAASEAAVRTADAALAEHPDIRYAGFLHDAKKEFVEARLTLAFVRGDAVPLPDELGVEVPAYLNGMAEAASELRRRLLDLLRRGEVEPCERLLATMDDVYGLLVTIDFPDAVTGGLRRTTDALRAVLERTRGDFTNALVQERVRRAVEGLLDR